MKDCSGEAKTVHLHVLDVVQGDDGRGQTGADVGAHDDGNALLDREGAGGDQGDNQGGCGRGRLEEESGEDAESNIKKKVTKKRENLKEGSCDDAKSEAKHRTALHPS